MKIGPSVVIATLSAAFFAAQPAISASIGTAPPSSAQIVVTAVPDHGVTPPKNLGPDDISVSIDKTQARVVGSQPLTGDLANMQLFILLDDSTRSSSLSLQLQDLKKFVSSLPPTTQVAVGYMQNGTFSKDQGFTSDHQTAANALRLPYSLPGGNGSPYFALSDLVKHWPSKEVTGRRVVLMLTDGVDRYYGNSVIDDPYVDDAIQDAAKHNVMVYSIYLRGAGSYGRGDWGTNVAQSRLSEVSDQTGGHAYFQDFTDPVSVAPFLADFQNRLGHQYELTVQTYAGHGLQPVEIRSHVRGFRLQGPTRVYLQ